MRACVCSGNKTLTHMQLLQEKKTLALDNCGNNRESRTEP